MEMYREAKTSVNLLVKCQSEWFQVKVGLPQGLMICSMLFANAINAFANDAVETREEILNANHLVFVEIAGEK